MFEDWRIQRNPDGSLMYPWYDPRNLETGWTERQVEGTGQTLSSEGGSQINPTGILGAFDVDPGAYNVGDDAIYTNPEGTTGTFEQLYGAPIPTSTNTTPSPSPSPTNTGGGDSGINLMDFNSKPGEGWTWHGDNDGWKRDNDGGLAAQINLARGAYENAMKDLQSVFGQAQGVFDQGMGSVGKIRDRATESYNTGLDNILNRFTGERGNLQRESVGNRNRLRGTMRALGMGGSAYVRGIGSQDKANARAIGALRQSRGVNELANTQQQTQSFDFADTQQGALDRFLQQASRALQSGQEKASLVQQGDVAGINTAFGQLQSNIFAQQAAMESAGGAAAGYQVDPYAVNIGSMIGSLNSGLPQFTGQTAVEGGNVNLAPENMSWLDKLKQRPGGSLYT